MRSQARADTEPEIAIRKLLFADRLRYRTNLQVPGMPRRSIDIAFTRARVAVFVDGCFWHGCPMHSIPVKNNARWWKEKLLANQLRDAETTQHLSEHGWLVIRVWEHEAPAEAAARIAANVRQRLLIPPNRS